MHTYMYMYMHMHMHMYMYMCMCMHHMHTIFHTSSQVNDSSYCKDRYSKCTVDDDLSPCSYPGRKVS